MCGIAGVIRNNRRKGIRPELELALELMRERGPDHSDTWVQGSVGLGHTRLSIIDLDPRSHQPFLIEDKLALTYNGEVYNFRALRAELEALGHSFSTTSDTEVLAKGYLQWGLEIVSRLDGMFAFALLDRESNSLHLARDPFGQKPLYVYRGPQELLFASDIRALQKTKRAELTINLSSLDYYLKELSVPQPLSIWNEISQIPPATVCTVSLTTYEWSEHRYWSPPTRLDILDEQTALELVEEKLVAAICKRTIADVPVGCFLSGGVDSGLVVSMLAANSKERIRTFTVSLEGHSMDEAPLARKVAERYNTDHTEVVVKADLPTVTEKMCEYCGEPFADSSLLPSYLVCQEISRHLKVALSGDGGDELFGGYAQYLRAYKTDQFLRNERRLPMWRARVAADKVFSRFSGRENLGSFEHYARTSGAQRLFRQMGFSATVRHSLWKRDACPGEVDAERLLQQRWDAQESTWLSDHLMRASLSTRLLNDYLVKVDRSSMAHSLEVRSPLLDRSLADLAFRISPDLKFKDGHPKYLLKKFAQKYFAEDIFERQKTGFSIPIKEWLMDDRFNFGKERLLQPNSWISQFFEPSVIGRLWHRRSVDDNAHGLWALICLEIWGQGL